MKIRKVTPISFPMLRWFFSLSNKGLLFRKTCFSSFYLIVICGEMFQTFVLILLSTYIIVEELKIRRVTRISFPMLRWFFSLNNKVFLFRKTRFSSFYATVKQYSSKYYSKIGLTINQETNIRWYISAKGSCNREMKIIARVMTNFDFRMKRKVD